MNKNISSVQSALETLVQKESECIDFCKTAQSESRKLLKRIKSGDLPTREELYALLVPVASPVCNVQIASTMLMLDLEKYPKKPSIILNT